MRHIHYMLHLNACQVLLGLQQRTKAAQDVRSERMS